MGLRAADTLFYKRMLFNLSGKSPPSESEMIISYLLNVIYRGARLSTQFFAFS